jgi:hypothetical protein
MCTGQAREQRNSVIENESLETEGVVRNSEQGICSVRSKEEGWSHILRCGRTKIGGIRIWTNSAEISMQKYVPGG